METCQAIDMFPRCAKLHVLVDQSLLARETGRRPDAVQTANNSPGRLCPLVGTDQRYILLPDCRSAGPRRCVCLSWFFLSS